MVVISGEASLRVGGEIDGPYTESQARYAAPSRGGETKRLKAGDVVNVPAGMPPQFLVPAGQRITFFTMKIVEPS